MSNLSELLPAGAGAKSADFVASGTLGSGVTVALKSDGTVEAVASDAGGPEVGTAVVFEAAALPTSNDTSIAFDSANNKVVVAYRDTGNSNYGTAIVGTVSGNTISFGTAVVFQSTGSLGFSASYDSSNSKVVIAYYNGANNDYGTAIVGTVSGTSISFGSAAVFESAASYNISTTFDSNSNKIVISYRDNGNSDYGTAIVGTVSGTSISFGSAAIFNSAASYSPTSVFDSSNNKIVAVYKDGGNSFYGTAIVGTVSGTSISFGSATVFKSANTTPYIGFDSSENKTVVAYKHGSTLSAVVGTVSGTSISFGSEENIGSYDANSVSVTYDSSANKIVVFYNADGASYAGSAVTGTVSGTSITFDSPIDFSGVQTYAIASTFDSNANKVVVAYTDANNSSYGTAAVFTTSGSNNTSFIGITDQAIADTATGAVIVQGGVSEKLSGLTVGADYYVQADGVLASGSVPYSISGASLTTAFTISQDSVPTGIAFKTDGTKMFICGRTNSSVFQYSLSSAFDVSTASYDSVSFSFSAQQTTAAGMAFNADGTSMYVLSYAAATVYQYTLSVGFDLTTASYASKSFSVSSQEGEPHGIAFKTDGTKMYIVGVNNDTVYQYSLSSAFDVSTASYDSVSFSIGSQESIPLGLTFGDSGRKMYVVGTSGDAIDEYSLLTAFDISSASFSTSFSVSGEESDPRQMVFSADGTKMFVVGSGSDEVNQYSTTAASTSVPAGKALSTTSILLEG